MRILSRLARLLVEPHPRSPDPNLSYLQIGRPRPPRKGSIDEWLFQRVAKRLDPFYLEEDAE